MASEGGGGEARARPAACAVSEAPSLVWSLPRPGRRSGFVDADMVESTEGSMRARRAGVALGERRRAEESREGKCRFGRQEGQSSGSRGKGGGRKKKIAAYPRRRAAPRPEEKKTRA